MADGGDDPTYKVGRGKPPLDTRIKVGETRNPWGRKGKPKPKVKPKPELAYQSFDKALSRQVKARQADGRTITMTAEEAIWARLINDALQGIPAAQRAVMAFQRDKQKSLPAASELPVGAVVLREPARNGAEWLALVAQYEKSRPADRWAGTPGYDPVTKTFQGLPVDTANGGFLRTPQLSSVRKSDDEKD